jgi:hypothetical protein
MVRNITLNDPSWTLEEAVKRDDPEPATAAVKYNYGCWGGEDSVSSAEATTGSDPIVAEISYGYGRWSGGCGCGGSGCGNCGGG